MAATIIKEVLQSRVKELNASSSKLKKVKDWINGYRGKIILLKPLGGQAYHLIFTKDKVELQEGEYPSVDLTYTGDEQNLVDILSGKVASYELIKKGQLAASQNLHESFRFEEILRSL